MNYSVYFNKTTLPRRLRASTAALLLVVRACRHQRAVRHDATASETHQISAMPDEAPVCSVTGLRSGHASVRP